MVRSIVPEIHVAKVIMENSPCLSDSEHVFLNFHFSTMYKKPQNLLSPLPFKGVHKNKLAILLLAAVDSKGLQCEHISFGVVDVFYRVML